MKNIPKEDIAHFRKSVIFEMDKMGASEDEKNLLHDEAICNAINQNRLPETVAWAILQ